MTAALVARSFWAALTLLTAVCVFVPLNPLMPTAELDPSWMFGMNEAVARGLAFGRDIVFTYGPFASVHTRMYHPATDGVMLAGSAWLALSCAGCLWFVLQGQRTRLLLVLLLLAALQQLPDTAALSLPFLVGLAASRMAFDPRDGLMPRRGAEPVLLAFFVAPMGLFPLIKVSVGVLGLAILIVCALVFLLRRRFLLAGVCVLVPATTMLALWVVSGQALADLPRYVGSMPTLMSGYAEAMALKGRTAQLGWFIVAALSMAWLLARRMQAPPLQRAHLLCLFGIYLFLSFKAGFVRHDTHAVIAAMAIMMSAVLLPVEYTVKRILLVAVPTLLCAGGVFLHYTDRTSVAAMARSAAATYASAWTGLEVRLQSPGGMRGRYEAALQQLRRQSLFPSLEGSSDIYSGNQAYLIAAGLQWSPRPMLQSYSAYTPALAELNRRHLLGPKAPQNVLFAIEPLDDRLPSLEDGASWPTLLEHYRPTRIHNGFAILRRHETASTAAPTLPLGTALHRLGEIVTLPPSERLLFARIDIEPTLLGRLVAFLFRPVLLDIRVQTAAGESKTLRLVSGMARSGFVLSPLVENTTEFALLWTEPGRLANKRLRSFSIVPRSGGGWLWKTQYRLSLSALPAAAQPVDAEALRLVDRLQPMPTDPAQVVVGPCAGGIDRINTQPMPATSVSASAPIAVEGWLTTAISDPKVPDQTYVVLTDEQQRRWLLPARRAPRTDVAQHFQQPHLTASGYVTAGNITALSGRFRLSLAVQDGQVLRLCNQLEVPLEIRP